MFWCKIVQARPVLLTPDTVLHRTAVKPSASGVDAQALEAEQPKNSLISSLRAVLPVDDTMFDNITNHYTEYSQYLRTASTKTILQLRSDALHYYTDPNDYSSVESKFDNFVADFRPQTANFDRFAFSAIDFLLHPGLGVEYYSGAELARTRNEMINTIPGYASPSQRSDFIAIIDQTISKFPNGGNLGQFYTKKSLL
ncbi:hypothetical protein HMPREF1544_10429 [Mucor circinelloides 1006PhL]|uniref:Uncharacterized protein n=1 Tax=Mucor circinelloides f. circinelloides (strain 1006PhL) TaxID=1220926 RepID=S2JSM5_MUCC1|nr:hypothetical protein HMPREF1544_10429 [Mucor circinelloides 1006PhL]